ncbi:hypothetical protein O197_29 [Edwardsiella phage eiAU-183]|uniref:HTH cro/C1-type domain-containing protein n=2 Tax=Eiauvirus eiAU TaxID=1982112 RepID=W0LMY7_9CAUD|nr:hypothetical protein CH09_gp29 [Edwardsiella phage eiAU-183]YP_009613879.1 hypothetical protein FDI58_gp29 [Edwardsiella phage eiAU]AHG23445.1 hypothetical protein P858_29 [Edwardsiella phage eiAU]AHG23499.1 hypothetical protein O197_29 [Edwardsiella phage eiAU-183]
MAITTTLAERIRSEMTKQAMTPAQLARATGLSRPFISQLLNGNAESMNSKNLFRMADVLRCDPRWLAEG